MTDDIELAHLLLSAAEKVGYQEYYSVDRLIAYCEQSTSAVGNTVQRLVHHFAGALRARMESETGRVKNKKCHRWEEVVGMSFRPKPALLVCYNRLPFSRITQLTEVQIILDTVPSST